MDSDVTILTGPASCGVPNRSVGWDNARAMGAATNRFVAAISSTPGATWMAATRREQRTAADDGPTPDLRISDHRALIVGV